MKTRIVAYIVLLSTLINVCANGDQTEPKSGVQSQVDGFVAKLARGEIEKVEILQIPPYYCTDISTTPERLELIFHYKLIIRDIGLTVYRDKLLKAMKTVTVQAESEIGDMRWGVIFYDEKDNRVGAIYMDKWGSAGAVGDIPVSFKGNLFKWLDRSFSCCFR